MVLSRLAIGVLAPLGLVCWAASVSEAASATKGDASSALVVPAVQRSAYVSSSGLLMASLGAKPLGGAAPVEAVEAVGETPGSEVHGAVVGEPGPVPATVRGPGASFSLQAPFSARPPLSAAQLEADTVSRGVYEGVSGGEAVALAERVWGVEHPSWSPPASEAGARVLGYPSPFTAAEETSRGMRTLEQSNTPLRVENSSGVLSAVSLKLREVEGAFVPMNPVVPISISRSVAGGVSLPGGVTMAPLDASATASPALVGNRVVWPGTATDTDFMAEPLPAGVETSWQLRSEQSSPSNALVFHLAPTESLQMSAIVQGGVEVVREGQPVVMVMPVRAEQANGESLPASYSLSGDVLTTHVDLEGPVDFPVLVDPVAYGWYGEAAGDNAWQNWKTYSTCGGCFGFPEYSNLIQAGAEYTWPAGNYGEWFLPTPVGGAARITRVDVDGLIHGEENQSTLNIGIYGDNGKGIWTTNGYGGAMGEQPLRTNSGYGGSPMAICAETGGGTDGGERPLCAECKREEAGKCVEAWGGTGFWIGDYLDEPRNEFNWVSISGATVRFVQTAPPSAELEEGYRPPERWFNSQREPHYVRAKGEDKGLGVSSVGIDYEEAGKAMSVPYGSKLLPGSEAYSPPCSDPYCGEWAKSAAWSLSGLGTGAWTVGGWAHNAAYLETEKDYPVYVDNTPPAIETPSWKGATFGEGPHELTFAVTDGSVAHPQSGVHWVALSIDGTRKELVTTKCPEPKGDPEAACFSLSGSWTFSGEGLSPGKHTVTLESEDWAGNKSSTPFEITIEQGANQLQQLGPGTLNLLSGDYSVSATDASVSTGAASLSVARTYKTQTPGTLSGPLGPGWTLSTPDASAAGQWQSLEPLENGSVQAVVTTGQKAMFEPAKGGGYTASVGYQTYTLTEPSTSPVRYRIADSSGDYTEFEKPAGASSFMPTKVGQAIQEGGLNGVTYLLTNGETSQIIGPQPAGVTTSCVEKPLETKGCRSLTLNYDKKATTAGESESEWGGYEGHLESVSFTAYDPAKEKITTTTVADYVYDKQGRLREEWDPQVEPTPLKTIYGYDARGDLTAVTSPGEEPYLLEYGTVANAQGSDWLLSLTRPGEKVAAGDGSSPTNTKVPTLSTTHPVVGTTLEVKSEGTWSNTPLAYSYQWEDCNGSGTECSPIPGATNQSYTPQERDGGHTLLAQVYAQNAYGTTAAATAASSVVPQGSTSNDPIPPAPKPGASAITTVEYGVPVSGGGAPYKMGASEVSAWGQQDTPGAATAIFPADEPQGWPASHYTRATVFYFDAVGRRVNVASPGEAISMTEYELWGNVDRTLTPGNRKRVVELGSSSASEYETREIHSSDGTELLESYGPVHEVKLANGKLVHAEAHAVNSYEEGAPEGGPYRLVTKSTEGAAIISGGEGEADQRTIKTHYSGQSDLGWYLHKPTSVTVEEQQGKTTTRTNVYSANTGDLTETTGPEGANEHRPPLYSSQFASLGSGAGQLKGANALALDESGDVWVADAANHRIDEFSTTRSFLKAVGWGVKDGKSELETCTTSCKTGLSGAGAGEFAEPQGITFDESNGDLYISDAADERIDVYSTAGAFVKAFGWGVADGKAELETCTTSCRAGTAGAGKGQLSSPHGLTADTNGNIWVADDTNSRLEKFSAEGAYIAAYGQEGKGNGEFTGIGDAVYCKGDIYATDIGGERVEEFSTAGKFVTKFGGSGEENGQFKHIGRLGCVSHTNELYVSDEGTDRVDIFTLGGEFIAAFGSAGSEPGELNTPTGLAITSSGAVLTNDSSNGRIETWTQPNPAAKASQATYYTTATNTKYPECGGHPEWAGLLCQTRPAAQPGDTLPELPVTTTTYNVWDDPSVVTQTSAAATRTTTTTYDSAGRVKEVAVSSTTGKSVPPVVYEYSALTGMATKQSTTSEGHTKSLTSTYNKLGELLEYTDASGTTSKYKYDVDGRVSSLFDGKGEQTYTYSPTTGQLSTLKDSAAGTFSATYNAEGALETQTYPNAMEATYTYDTAGQATSLVYKKGSTVWYSDVVIPSIHGQWLTQETTLGTDSYTYDEAGRLVEAREESHEKGCTTDLYTYDEGSSRTSETTRAPTSEGKCAATGGTSTDHAYDTAERLDDADAEYEPLGAATDLPADDTGGHLLESSYYSNGSLYQQTQNGQTNTYVLDPAGRELETTDATISSSTTAVDHYDSSGSNPAWTEGASGTFSRNIGGINGSLCAIETGATAVTIEIANLHGDIIGTAPDSSETKTPTLTSEPTAFGVPTTAGSSSYKWLGAGGLKTELESGVASNTNGSYVPQLGIHLLPEAANPSALQDPVNEYLNNTKEAEPIGETNATSPGAIEPVFVPEAVLNEFWEHPPWDKPPVNVLSHVIEEESINGTGGDSAGEAAAFDHTWSVQPWVASALGEAITVDGSDIGQYALGLVAFPAWLHKALDAMTGGQLETYAGELMYAGDEAAAGTLVDINVWGSLRMGFHIDVSYWVEREE